MPNIDPVLVLELLSLGLVTGFLADSRLSAQLAVAMPRMPHGAVGYLYVPGVVIVSIASITAAPWGARTAHRTGIAPLKKVFASVLYLIAAYFFH